MVRGLNQVLEFFNRLVENEPPAIFIFALIVRLLAGFNRHLFNPSTHPDISLSLRCESFVLERITTSTVFLTWVIDI